MTLKEFGKILKENKELFEKLKQAKKEFKFEEGKENEGLSKIVASLGYDVPASEFALGKIGKKEINEDELKSVAGGTALGCYHDYVDTDCLFFDFCDFMFTMYT